MLTTTPRHNLSSIDIDHRTATCSVCGDTQIFVEYTPKRHELKVGCVEGRKAKQREYDARSRARKHPQSPNWKPQHRLRKVDLVTMTGICAVCGPTIVHRRGRRHVVYICMNKLVTDARARYGDNHVYKPRRSHPAFLPRSQRENMKLIDAHKTTHGCRRCGYNADPLELELHFRDLPESEFTVSKVALFNRKRLRHALRKCEVYCRNCHLVVHSELEGLSPAALYQVVR
jgi:hypothetical protein